MERYKHLHDLIKVGSSDPSLNAIGNETQPPWLAALRRTGLLDSAPEPEFDRITRLAARLLRVPIVLMTLVDEQREFFKSAVGLSEPWATQRQAPFSHSFSRRVVATDAPLIIEDARKHSSTSDNPAITEPGAYLGVPIHAPGGEAIGAFCAIDHKPRRWTEEEVELMRDLTASVATEIASRWWLQESQHSFERFAHFMNASSALIYVFDIVEGRSVFSSRAGSSSPGAPKQMAEQTMEYIGRNMHPDDQRRFSDHLKRMRQLPDGETVVFEYRMRQPDGSWRWFLSHNTAFTRDNSGALRQVISSVIDITERKQVEERLELALQGAELGTWDWNIQTGEVIFNRRWAEMLGYAPDEVEQNFSSWERLVHPEDRRRVINAIQAHHKGRTPRFSLEHRLRAKDGTWRWILTSGKITGYDSEGEPTRTTGIHRDITAQKTAEAAAHASDRQLARILESMTEACSAVDAKWRYTFINSQWETFFGWRKEDVIGRSLWEVVPEYRGTILEENYRKVMTEREPICFEILSPIVHRWLEIRLFPAADGGLSTFILDIHERKMASERLEDADRRKDEFISMLGHELRNPLAAIRHALGVCNTDESLDVFLWAKGVVDRQSAHLSRLVDDLLDMARITRGKVELRKQLIDIATVLDQAVEATRPLILERHHELSTSYKHGLLWVDGDPTRLEQVVSNLLNNAAKYTPPGGHIWLDAKSVNDGVESPTHADVVISIRDTGSGIAAENLSKMFDLFVQGERSLARSEGGLGLGLTITKELTEMHGGYVTAHSEGLGRGSTFTVHLPGTPAPPHGASPTRTPVSDIVIPHRILVVDDLIDSAQALARLLKRQGHTVEIANDGFDACEKAHTFAPEIVLLDIGLPGMDGYDVARHLRQDKCCSDALIIALTGYGQEEDRRHAMEAGFDEHLVKPVDIDRLKHLISEYPARLSSDRCLRFRNTD